MLRLMKILLPGLVLVFAVSHGCPEDAVAQDDTEQTRQEKIIDHWLKVSRDQAEATQVSCGDEPVTLFDKPVFRHTQSVRGDDIGSMHLWTLKDGRPAVIGVFFAWSQNDSRWVMCEFHSLQDGPVKLLVPGTSASWSCADPGLTWRPFDDDVPAPADTATRRRLQSRQLSRRFAAHTIEGEKNRWELRLVPAPIYTYSTNGADELDGAVYAFCQGTDTEVLLLIEAFRQLDQWHWRYSLAHFTDYEANVTIDDEPVWKSPDGALGRSGKPHYWNFVVLQPKPDFEKQ
ncbi:MAG: hypothetical protein R3C19_14775 [Planctomycetaceae bacterium]